MKIAIIIAFSVVLTGGLFGNYLRYGQPTATGEPEFSLIPYESGPYSGEERRYSEQAYFSSQAYGRQIHSPRHCLPGGGWRIDSSQAYELTLTDSLTADVNQLIIGRDDSRQVMLYWFQTQGGVIANEYAVKLNLVRSALAFQPTDAAFIRVTTSIQGNDIEGATERAADLLRHLYGDIVTAMPFDN